MATSKDPREFETLTRRWIAVQRAGTRVGNDLGKGASKAFMQVRRIARDPGLSQAVKIQQINKFMSEAKVLLFAELTLAMKATANAVVGSVFEEAKALGMKGKAPKVTDAKIKAWIKKVPMADTGITTAALFEATFDSAKRAATGTVMMVATDQMSKTGANQRMKGIGDKLARDMGTLGQTAVNQTANSTKQMVYKAAKKVANRVMWTSTLDHRTSPFCQAADGRVFPLNSGPRPPAHPRCRSTVVLVGKDQNIDKLKSDLTPRAAVEAKSKAALDKQGLTTRNNKVRKPSRTNRSPLKGTTTNATSYENWMGQQPNYYQDKVLGKNAAKRLRNGESLTAVLQDTRSSIDFSSLKEALN